MPKKIFIHVGHGGSDSGAVGNGMREADIVLAAALEFANIARPEGFEVRLSRETDVNVGNSASIANAWGADCFIDFHANAHSILDPTTNRWVPNPSANGYETFYPANKPQDRAFAECIHQAYLRNITIRDRGVKPDGQTQHSGGITRLRQTQMPACLVEFAFITAHPTNFTDVSILQNPSAMAKAVLHGVLAFFDIEKPSSAPSAYEVDEETAQTIERESEEVPMRFNTVSEVPEWARPTIQKLVAYCDYKNMPMGILRGNNGDGTGLDLSMDMVRILVLLDREGLFSMPASLVPPSTAAEPPTLPPTAGNPILGKPILTAEQLAAFLLSREPNPQIYCTPLELAQYFIEEGNKVGVRGDIAFMQSIHETGWFRFGGQVLPEQNNFAGFGAIDGTTIGQGNNFGSPEVGVRAQIHHLFVYATTDPLPNGIANASPRAQFVQRGIAVNWEDLNGRWAVPGNGYGEGIIALFNTALAFANIQ